MTQRAHAKKEADYHARTHILMPRPPADTRVLIPTSIVLQRLHDEVPTDHFTLGWLKHSLHKSSFGIIMLLLALVAIAPGASIVAGLLLMIPALQMIAGNPRPSLSTPHRHLFFADETPHRCGATTPHPKWSSARPEVFALPACRTSISTLSTGRLIKMRRRFVELSNDASR